MSNTKRDPFSSLVDNVRSGVLDSLGEDTVLSMFITGSVPKRETGVFENEDKLEVYSDVDVVVVVRDGADVDTCRRRIAELAAQIPLSRDNVRHCVRPDIGVYSRDQFVHQPVRPGTVGIPSAHELLHGDETVPLSFDPTPESIDVGEALYLIENRLTELAEAAAPLTEPGVEPAVVRAAHYAALKAGADAVTAVLVAAGGFHPSRGERVRRFLADTALRERFLRGESVDWVRSCARSLDDLQSTIASNPAGVLKAAGETTAVLVETWCSIAAQAFEQNVADVSDLFLIRCQAGRQTSHLRQAFVLSKRIGYRTPRVIHAAIAKRAWVIADLLPTAALRVASTVEAHAAREQDPSLAHTRVTRYLEALTSSFGYREGTLYQRARAMYKDAIR